MSASKEMLSEMSSRTREMRARGADLEDTREVLRATSPAIVDSIKTVRYFMDVSLDEAKKLVHYSRAWSDLRDSNAEVHERAEGIASDLDAVDRADGTRRVEIDLKREL